MTLLYDTDIGENYGVVGLRFYCKAAKGSHPQYNWFLNNTLLNDYENKNFYMVHQDPEQSVLLLAVDRRSAGTYRCVVSDDFDHTTAISSKRIYLDKEGTNDILYCIQYVICHS